MVINAKTSLYGIIGFPVSHSFSPEMQTLAFQSLGINAVYLPFPIEEEQLPKLLDSFWILGIQGFNITVPYKERIVEFLPELDAQAKALGSVNTVIRLESGWKGYSTDGKGLIRSLLEWDFDPAGKSILLAGAGGSAKAVALALAGHQAERVHILNRTHQKAQNLADLLQKKHTNLKLEINPPDGQTYDLMINCTSVGMKDSKCPVTDAQIKSCRFVVDIIYNPPKTTLLQKAEEFNIPNINGLGMLLHQGAEAFEIWTKKPAPIEVMRQSLLSTLNLPK